MQRCAMALLGCAVGLCGPAALFAQEAPDAAALLRSMAEYHGSVEHATFSCTIELEMVGVGTETRYWAHYDGLVSRPGRMRLDHTGGLATASMVVGPEQTFVLGAEHNRYVKGDGVEDVVDAFGQHDVSWLDWQWRMLVGPGLKTIVASDPLGLIEGALHTAEFVGTEDVQGQATNRVRITGGGVPFDMWIAAEGDPRLVKASYPLPQDWIDAGWLPESKGYWAHYTSWETPQTIPQGLFAFNAAEAEEARTIAGAFFGAAYDEMGEGMEDGAWEGFEAPEVASLQGHEAPDFELATTGGGSMSLAAALEENKVVVLDFWATWCPPCREGLPVLDQLVKDYEGKGVVIYAVNVQESEKVAARFMEQQELSLPVALDTDGSVSEAYMVGGIPQTVVIDADGTVRAVHVGFSPTLRKDLSKEIDASLAGEPAPRPAERTGASALPDAENMSQQWSVRGMWTSAAVDRSGNLVVGGFEGVALMAADGEITRRFRGNGMGTQVRSMRLADGEQGYVVFSRWGEAPMLLDAQGKRQWSVPRGDGPNDAWPADLDGDGVDELIVGYNGGTGVRAFDASGKEIWANRAFGNIWYATAHDLDGDGKAEAITTSAGGTVHVFDGVSGRQKDLLWKGEYASLVRPATRQGEPIVLISAGGRGERENAHVIAIDRQGAELWRVSVPGYGRVHEAVAAVSRPWGAASFDGGLVCVFDLNDGRVIARTDAGGRQPMVAWHESEADPTLIVANGSEIVALSIEAPDAQ